MAASLQTVRRRNLFGQTQTNKIIDACIRVLPRNFPHILANNESGPFTSRYPLFGCGRTALGNLHPQKLLHLSQVSATIGSGFFVLGAVASTGPRPCLVGNGRIGRPNARKSRLPLVAFRSLAVSLISQIVKFLTKISDLPGAGSRLGCGSTDLVGGLAALCKRQ